MTQIKIHCRSSGTEIEVLLNGDFWKMAKFKNIKNCHPGLDQNSAFHQTLCVTRASKQNLGNRINWLWVVYSEVRGTVWRLPGCREAITAICLNLS